MNSYDPSLVEFLFVLRSSRIHLKTAISFFVRYQLFPCANGLRITQEHREMQASPRVDVDEAPNADLLFVTELVDVHDSIMLLNSDDHLGFYTETLLISKSDEASEQRVLLSRSPVSSCVHLKSTFFRCENRNFFELCERVDPSALIQSQICCLASKCELCWKFNVTPLSRLTRGGVLFVSQHEHVSRISFVLCPSLCRLHVCTQQFTDHQHRLTCLLRRRLDQHTFGFACVQNMVRTPV